MNLPPLPIPLWLVGALWLLAIVVLRSAKTMKESGFGDSAFVNAVRKVQSGLVLIVFIGMLVPVYIVWRRMLPNAEFVTMLAAMFGIPIVMIFVSIGIGKIVEAVVQKLLPSDTPSEHSEEEIAMLNGKPLD